MDLPALSGRTHDLTAARTHRIIRICERQGVPVLADRAYMGAGPWVTTPIRRPPGRGLTPTQQTVNRALSAARAPVERGVARLKSWRIFRKARCSPNRVVNRRSRPRSGAATLKSSVDSRLDDQGELRSGLQISEFRVIALAGCVTADGGETS
ncbi:transposase family protein [Streptomyces coeruleorubidus]|nr:transposase family protein [Streptomyces coeruleorubidus]WDV54239.1 transposase family protein [Streptomyces coeruleorubidus]